MRVIVRRLRDGERDWVRDVMRERWGSEVVVAHGVVHRPATLEGLVAEDGGRRVGILTYAVEGDACEIVTIDALEPRRGIGRSLVEAVASLGQRRVWLITTNDNVGARRFYEALGFRLAAVHEGAVDRSRELKPEIPLLGEGEVEIRDELEYELTKDDRPSV